MSPCSLHQKELPFRILIFKRLSFFLVYTKVCEEKNWFSLKRVIVRRCAIEDQLNWFTKEAHHGLPWIFGFDRISGGKLSAQAFHQNRPPRSSLVEKFKLTNLDSLGSKVSHSEQLLIPLILALPIWKLPSTPCQIPVTSRSISRQMFILRIRS